MRSKDFTPLLDNLIIAAPCQVAWASMKGTDRARDCSQCSRKVYNLSDMSRSEAESFLAENGTSHCATFYRRADGTILTDDCPVGLRKLRDRCRTVVKIASSLVAILLALPAAMAQNRNELVEMGKPMVKVRVSGEPSVVQAQPVIKQVRSVPNHLLGVPAFRDPQEQGENKGTESQALSIGKNGLPNEDADFGSGLIRLRIEKAIGPDSRAYHQYLRAIDNEDKGKHLVAAAYYKDALRTMTESAVNTLDDNQSSYDPRLKQAIEEHLRRLQKSLCTDFEPLKDTDVDELVAKHETSAAASTTTGPFAKGASAGPYSEDTSAGSSETDMEGDTESEAGSEGADQQ